MQLKPTITFDQYTSVLQAIRSNHPKPKKQQWRGVLLGGAIGLALVFLYERPSTRVSAYILSTAFVLWFIIAPRYFRNRYKAALKVSFEDQKYILNGNEMDIDESGISGSWVGGQARYKFAWKAFSSFIDRPDDILFLYAPCCWIRVPKDQASAEEQSTILNWYKSSTEQYRA